MSPHPRVTVGTVSQQANRVSVMYQNVSDFAFKQLKSVILGTPLEKSPICLQHLLFTPSFKEAEGIQTRCISS